MIIGKLIPAATGLRRYRRLEIEPSEPLPRPTPEEIGLLDESELAAELGLTGEGLEDFSFGNGESGTTFGDELADLANAPLDDGSSSDDSVVSIESRTGYQSARCAA